MTPASQQKFCGLRFNANGKAADRLRITDDKKRKSSSAIRHPSSAYGFTLIELSIVLVIIGLIVGGVLVGRDLIMAAKFRNLVSQIEKYNAAVHTFQLKYENYLPGDIPPSVAANYGLLSIVANAGASGYGDNNGKLSGGAVGVDERLLFWRHLSDAGLIAGSYGSIGNAAIIPSTDQLTAALTTQSDFNLATPPHRL